MKKDLEIYLLGSFRLSVKSQNVSPAAWQKRKAKLLVQILALKPSHEIHREELIEILFPEETKNRANANFYRILHAARKALEPHRNSYAASRFLINEGLQIKLAANGALWIDAEDFEKKACGGLKNGDAELLESAAEIYRGDLLEDEPFEDLFAGYRDKLSMLFHSVLRRLAENAEQRNAIDQAHLWYDRLLHAEPLDETAHRGKMRLYAAQGNTPLALRQYEKCRALLKSELAVEPDIQTERLKQKIRAASLK